MSKREQNLGFGRWAAQQLTKKPANQQMFQNIVAIVSGGASGLGAATASYLVKNGARVIVADLPSSAEQFGRMQAEVVAESDRFHERLKFAQVDVTCEEDVVSALDVAASEFGEQGTFVCAHLTEFLWMYSPNSI